MGHFVLCIRVQLGPEVLLKCARFKFYIYPDVTNAGYALHNLATFHFYYYYHAICCLIHLYPNIL